MADDDLREPARPRRLGGVAATPRDVPDEDIASVRDVSFPAAMRGYDRVAVDAYVTRVNRIIAELQVTRSPQSAIRHALDEMSEETAGILERAHASAEEIARRSRAQADDRVQSAEREAHEILADANARVRELEADIDAVRRERNRLLEDVRLIAEELEGLALRAAERFPPQPGEPEAETVTFEKDELTPPADEFMAEEDEEGEDDEPFAEERTDGEPLVDEPSAVDDPPPPPPPPPGSGRSDLGLP